MADGHLGKVAERTQRLSEEAAALVAEVKGAALDAKRVLDLKGRMDRHPYATMAAAVGLGYVLGGGLFSRLTAQALRIGARAVLVPLLKAQLSEAMATPAAENEASPPHESARSLQ